MQCLQPHTNSVSYLGCSLIWMVETDPAILVQPVLREYVFTFISFRAERKPVRCFQKGKGMALTLLRHYADGSALTYLAWKLT